VHNDNYWLHFAHSVAILIYLPIFCEDEVEEEVVVVEEEDVEEEEEEEEEEEDDPSLLSLSLSLFLSMSLFNCIHIGSIKKLTLNEKKYIKKCIIV